MVGNLESLWLGQSKPENLTAQSGYPTEQGHYVAEGQQPLNILVLDDQPEACELIQRLLLKANPNHKIKSVSDTPCMPIELEMGYDVVLLDLHLGTTDGLSLLKEHLSNLPSFPVVLLTNDDNPGHQQQALDLGVADFIRKSELSSETLEKSIRYCTNLFKQYRLNEQMTAMERALSIDPLTKLHTTAYCHHQIEHLLSDTQRKNVSVLSCQIHNISAIGRGIGLTREIEIIQQYSHWLAEQVPRHHAFGITRDSQLLLVIADMTEEQTQRLSQQLSSQILNFQLENSAPFNLAHCVGAAHAHAGDPISAQSLMHHSLIALQTTRTQRQAYQLYNPELQEQIESRAIVVRDVTKALVEKQIYFNIQPQYRVSDGQLVGGELLMRWNHPQLGMVDPQMVVEVAEATQQIDTLGSYALRSALETIEHWLAKGLVPPNMRLAVNVSAAELESPEYFEQAAYQLSVHEQAAQFLELELTESIKLFDPHATGKELMRLRKYGVAIAIDDFGTAHANLGQLCHIDADTVKLDKSIVYAADNNKRARSIYSSIRNMIHALGTKIIAEGIETDAQLELARSIGIDIVQGYLMSQPLEIQAFEQLLQQVSTQSTQTPQNSTP